MMQEKKVKQKKIEKMFVGFFVRKMKREKDFKRNFAMSLKKKDFFTHKKTFFLEQKTENPVFFGKKKEKTKQDSFFAEVYKYTKNCEES